MAGKSRQIAREQSMILVDTSVWIDFLREKESSYKDELHLLIEKEQDICLADLILSEVLQGILDEVTFDKTRDYLLAFPIYRAKGIDTFIKTAQIYKKCRKEGKTIRSTIDCLLAAIAMERNLEVFHKDRDFEIISKYTKLRIYEPLFVS